MKKIFLITAAAAFTAAAVIFIHTLPHESDDPDEVFVAASTVGERMDYFASHGWEVEEISEKNVIIPSAFTQEYEIYAQMQDKQGLPLRKYAGENALLYVYEIKNYSPENRKMLAELLVCDNIAVASMVYSEDGSSIRLPVQ